MLQRLATALACFAMAISCARASDYEWTELTAKAAFRPSYNFPVHVAPDRTFVALHPDGAFVSADGAAWRPGSLPATGLNSAYLAFVAHEGAALALGRMTGNYQAFEIIPDISRTDDYQAWRDLGRSTTLPSIVFYAAASFDGYVWLIGGYDGASESDDVWRSRDGLSWERVTDRAAFGPRMGAKAVVFRERLFLIGGGDLDGPTRNDVWSTADGRIWRRETAAIAAEAPVGYSPIAFDGKLWLVGANRSGSFESGMLVSSDGVRFEPVSAPWSPRGGVAVWTDGAGLYLTGGKFSTGEGENIRFVYSNDVWVMRKRQKAKEPSK